MMPRSLSYFRYNTGEDIDALLESVAKTVFLPCTDLQKKSTGWAPVVDGHMVYTVAGFRVMRFVTETKALPSSAVKGLTDKLAKELEDQQGFPPGRKARIELRERAVDQLLPRVPASRRDTLVYIDTKMERIMIDSVSNGVIDDIIKAFFKAGGVELHGAIALEKALSLAVLDEVETNECGFSIDDRAVLEMPGEKRTLVDYQRAALADVPELITRIQQGGQVTSLALTWDDRVSFTLNRAFQLRGLKLTDMMRHDNAADLKEFDGSVLLAGTTLRGVIAAINQLKGALQ